MAAAARLFSTTGLSEVTVAQILDRSGVKAPTLYHHFGGKEGLYGAWARHARDGIESEFKAIETQNLALEEFLLESCRILLSQRSMDFIQVMRDRRWLADPDSAEQVNDAINVSVFRKIATAIQIGTDVEEPRDAAQLFVHMVSMRLPQYRRSDAFEGIAYDEIVRVFLQGIAAKVSPAQSTTVIEDAEPSEHEQEQGATRDRLGR